MHYALGAVRQLHVSGIVILAVTIEVMASWRPITKNVTVLLVAAVIIGTDVAGNQRR
jgi:hypothetical protein